MVGSFVGKTTTWEAVQAAPASNPSALCKCCSPLWEHTGPLFMRCNQGISPEIEVLPTEHPTHSQDWIEVQGKRKNIEQTSWMSGHVLLQEALESLVVRPDQATRHHNQVGTRWCEGRPIESSGSRSHLSPGSNADLNQNDILFAHEFRACQNAGSHGSCV